MLLQEVEVEVNVDLTCQPASGMRGVRDTHQSAVSVLESTVSVTVPTPSPIVVDRSQAMSVGSSSQTSRLLSVSSIHPKRKTKLTLTAGIGRGEAVTSPTIVTRTEKSTLLENIFGV